MISAIVLQVVIVVQDIASIIPVNHIVIRLKFSDPITILAIAPSIQNVALAIAI